MATAPRPDPEAVSHIITDWRGNPILFSCQSFRCDPGGESVSIDSQQARILRAVAEHDRVAVRTGRGIGKTAASAILVHWWLATRYPALVVTSAGSWGHLKDKLWPEIRTWARGWLPKDGFEYQQMGIYSWAEPDRLRAVATSSDLAVNVEGYHSPHLLLLIDEAKGMPDEIYAALVASLTGTTEQKIVVLSTPPLSKQGWFARVSSSSEWYTVHISGLDSPRVSREWVAQMVREFGEDSAEYQSHVLGEIPEGATETVVWTKWFEDAQDLNPNPSDTRPAVVTCDVAREGPDLCTFGVIEQAKFNLVRFRDGRPGWIPKSDVRLVAGRCLEAVQIHKAKALCIDDTGVGGA